MNMQLNRIVGKRVFRILLTSVLMAALTPLSADESRIAFEDPGKIKVVEGEQCGQSNRNGKEAVIVLDGSMAMPDYYGSWDATVFLNGWRLRYLGNDQHVARFAAEISDIRLNGNALRWEAGGVLTDDAFDDAYEFCYRYTAMAWARDAIRAAAAHDRLSNWFTNHHSNHPASALELVFASADVPDMIALPNSNTVILPSGIAFRWHNPAGGLEDFIDTEKDFFTFDFGGLGDPDHHLLQVSYNLGPVSHYSHENGIDPGKLNWASQVIFKDNDTRRDYVAVERVNPIGGEDVYMIDPPFAFTPIDEYASGLISSTGCIGAANEVNSEDIVVENVPFDYVIPVLTGWDMHYGCGADAHVLKIGVWVDNIQYDKDPDEATGTLRYRVSSVMRANDLAPFHNARYKVSILGLNAGALRINYEGPRPGELAGVDDSSIASSDNSQVAPTRNSIFGISW